MDACYLNKLKKIIDNLRVMAEKDSFDNIGCILGSLIGLYNNLKWTYQGENEDAFTEEGVSDANL